MITVSFDFPDIINVSCGSGPHVLALTKNGEVYSWGHNGYGQLGHGDTSIHTRVPSVISHGLGGEVVVERVSCGAYHSLALTKTGEVICSYKSGKHIIIMFKIHPFCIGGCM